MDSDSYLSLVVCVCVCVNMKVADEEAEIIRPVYVHLILAP